MRKGVCRGRSGVARRWGEDAARAGRALTAGLVTTIGRSSRDDDSAGVES